MTMTPEDARRLAGVLLDDSEPSSGVYGDGGMNGGRLSPGRFGRYQILRLVGTGGMGEVYEAEQDSPKRRVALKIIRPELVSPELRRRFEYEARTLARLEHPAIARIFDAGNAEPAGSGWGQTPYFAMEFVQGRPLIEYAQSQGLDLRRRLELFLRVCEGIEHAHRRGVIHRDLKPGNILVDDDGRPRVLDFGMARATDVDVRATTLHTEVGKLVGTLPYMSPEQVAGDVEHVDTRSDVYSLGVVLYELLADRPPYEIRRGLVHEAARIIREEDPAPLSSVSRAFRGDVETIVAKALEKEPGRRYQSVGELASDIRRYLDDEPIVAKRASTWYQVRKFARRNRAVAVAGMIAAAGLLAATVVSTLFALSQQRARAEAHAARLVAEEQRLLAEQSSAEAISRRAEAERETAALEAVLQFLGSVFGAAAPEQDGRDVRIVDVLARTSAEVEEHLADDPLIAASVLRTVGNIYRELGRYEEGVQHLRTAIELLRSIELPDERTMLIYEFELARLLAMNGIYSEAEPLLQRLREETLVRYGDEDPLYQRASGDLAGVLVNLGFHPDAHQMATESLEIQERVFGPLHDITMTTLGVKASALRGMRDWATAEEVIRELYDRELSIAGPRSPHAITHQSNLAEALGRRGKLEEARAMFEEALILTEEVLGPEHPGILPILNNLATLSYRAGDLESAITRLEHVLSIQETILRPGHPDHGYAISNYAYMLRQLGRLEEARAAHAATVAFYTQSMGARHATTIGAIVNKADVLVELGETSEALALYDRSIAQMTEPDLYTRAYRELLQIERARILIRMDRLDEAQQRLQASLEFAQQEGIPELQQEALKATVQLYEALDQPEAAAKYQEMLSALP